MTKPSFERAQQRHAAAASPARLTLICARCRATGDAEDEAFAGFGDLLGFTPVELKLKRADGWTPEVQKAFIAALAVTGSPRQAAAAVGRSLNGAHELLDREGSESFAAAWAGALAVAREKGEHRLAAGVQYVAAKDSRWAPTDGRRKSRYEQFVASAEDEFDDPDGEAAMAVKTAALQSILRKYILKLEQERSARTEGRIAEADFTLRQLTWLEVVMDALSGDLLTFLKRFRHKGHALLDIAETDASRLLGQLRRNFWEHHGAPPRPDHPPERFLQEAGDGVWTEPGEHTTGGTKQEHQRQVHEQQERRREEAERQIKWEAEALRAYERRRASGAAS